MHNNSLSAVRLHQFGATLGENICVTLNPASHERGTAGDGARPFPA